MYTALSSECRGSAVLRAGLGGWPCSRLCTPGLPIFCCLPGSSVFWNVTACSVLSCLRCGSPPPCPGSEGARQPGQRSAALPSTSTLSPFGLQDAARCMSRPTSPPPEPCLSPLSPCGRPSSGAVSSPVTTGNCPFPAGVSHGQHGQTCLSVSRHRPSVQIRTTSVPTPTPAPSNGPSIPRPPPLAGLLPSLQNRSTDCFLISGRAEPASCPHQPLLQHPAPQKMAFPSSPCS